MNWFWCLDHKCVEKDFGCGSTSRIGPYATQAEAEAALERTRKREGEQKERDASEEKKFGKRREWF